MFIGLADSAQHDLLNANTVKENLTLELETLELKSIDYQIEEQDENNFFADNNSDQARVDNFYFKQVKNETLTMNDSFIRNFGVVNPLDVSHPMTLQLNETLGETSDKNAYQM